MDIYCLQGQREKEFIALADRLKTNPKKSSYDFLNNGFTNYYEPQLYFCKRLKGRYPVSLNISIDKQTMEISSIEILDDEFGQPHFCDDDIFKQVKDTIDRFKKKELFV